MKEYHPVIGLEVHVHLKTKSKVFCGCSTEFGNAPNSQTCPVCLGFPGSLPVLNKLALGYAVKVGLALGCSIQEYTKFDRKNYFYPDLPKNYQISQYDLPIAKDGFLEIETEGKAKRIGIRRVHLEEDAGKLIHEEGNSLVDFNRAGMPLLEIVSEPDIESPQQAYEYLTLLKSVIEYLGVSDCDMEKGSLRCDANISVRVKGTKTLGTKTELKNMNSFKAVKEALGFEAGRQTEALNNGGKIVQETRLWEAKQARTLPMRTKEEAQDYRYFPEPDLPPFTFSSEEISSIRDSLPELPQEKLRRFVGQYGLLENDVRVLILSRDNADYAESCLKAYPGKAKKPVVNWLIGPLLSEANARNCRLSDLKIPPAGLIELVNFSESRQINNLAAKAVLGEMIASGKSASLIVKEKNLIQISDSNSLAALADEVIKENAKSAEDYRAGKANALMFLVGQVMRKTSGRADPKMVQEILKGRLAK